VYGKGSEVVSTVNVSPLPLVKTIPPPPGSSTAFTRKDPVSLLPPLVW